MQDHDRLRLSLNNTDQSRKHGCVELCIREMASTQTVLIISGALTHWCWVTHIYASVKCTIIGSDNVLLPERRQAIIWTNAGRLLTGPLGTNIEILTVIYTFSFKKMCLKMSSEKRRPSRLGLNVLKQPKEEQWTFCPAKWNISLWPESLRHWGIKKMPPFSRRHFICIFFNENVWISIKISLKLVPKGPINNIPALVQIMPWRQRHAIIWANDG